MAKGESHAGTFFPLRTGGRSERCGVGIERGGFLHADSRIGYLYDAVLVAALACFQGYCTSFGGKFYGVGQQVEQHHAEDVPVGKEGQLW